jgi:hypothetical protein
MVVEAAALAQTQGRRFAFQVTLFSSFNNDLMRAGEKSLLGRGEN